MSTNNFHSLDETFDDHASLSASLEDFEPNDPRSPTFGLPSQHSGFKSEESEEPESSSEGPWSPPAWKTQSANSGWYKHQPYLQRNPSLRPSVSASRSRDTSPRYEDAREEGDVTLAANIPLPRGSLSPVKERTPSPSPYPEQRQDFGQTRGQEEPVAAASDYPNNCVHVFVEVCKTLTDVVRFSICSTGRSPASNRTDRRRAFIPPYIF